MTGFYFGSMCKTMAETFLKHEAYGYLTKDQKEYILENLADNFRILDPNFHSPGILMNDPVKKINLLKLGNLPSEKLAFTYGYMSPDWDVFKWILDENPDLELPSYYFEKFVRNFNEEAIDHLLKINKTNKDQLIDLACSGEVDEAQIDVCIKLFKKYGATIQTLWRFNSIGPELIYKLYLNGLINQTQAVSLSKDSSIRKIIKSGEQRGEVPPSKVKRIIKELTGIYKTISCANNTERIKVSTPLSRYLSSVSGCGPYMPDYYVNEYKSLEHILRNLKKIAPEEIRDLLSQINEKLVLSKNSDTNTVEIV